MNNFTSDSTKVLLNIQKGIEQLFVDYNILKKIIANLSSYNTNYNIKIYLVGGGVRDIILGKTLKDIDLEIHGINIDELETILNSILPVNLVGKSFGVLKSYQFPIDFSVPRTDSSGRHPQIKLDPNMNIESALRRRDLTINAMAIDLINFNLVDPFNGLKDLSNKILRAPDNMFFMEDPLRFFRVMQFSARFEMSISEELNIVCKKMNISNISIERIEAEFNKMFLQSIQPSLGLRWINSLGRLTEILPELAATTTIKQEPTWHPEIYVFEHLMQTLDAASYSINSQNPIILELFKNITLDSDKKLLLLYAALCHDLGKVTTTKLIDGKLRSWGHAEAGVSLTKKLLKRITQHKKLIDQVATLVKYHMHPGELVKQNSSTASFKRLAAKLNPPLNLALLSLLFQADRQGRNGEDHAPLNKDLPEIKNFILSCQNAGVLYHAEKPLLAGQDLLKYIMPGPELGKILKKAYLTQINKNIKNKEELIQLIIFNKKI